MEGFEVRERLLRLNRELHSKRFRDTDVTPLLDLWDEAKEYYHDGNLERANQLIDDAYKILYSTSQPPRDISYGSEGSQRDARIVYTAMAPQSSTDKVLGFIAGMLEPCLDLILHTQATIASFRRDPPVTQAVTLAFLAGIPAAGFLWTSVNDFSKIIYVPVAVILFFLTLSFILHTLIKRFKPGCDFKPALPLTVYTHTPLFMSLAVIYAVSIYMDSRNAQGLGATTLVLLNAGIMLVYLLALACSMFLLARALKQAYNLEKSRAWLLAGFAGVFDTVFAGIFGLLVMASSYL